jgi:outer membrane protein insertion porin family
MAENVRAWWLIGLLAVLAGWPANLYAQATPEPPPETLAEAPPNALAAEVPADTMESFYGNIVADIDFDVPPYLNKDTIKKRTRIRAGKPLERWHVRQTLRNLYLLGYVENASILGDWLGSTKRVRITVRVYPRYLVRDVTVVGSTAYTPNEIINDILRIEPGDDYHEENLADYENKLREALDRAGHLKAEVKIDVDKADRHENNTADLRIKIEEKQKFRVARFDFTGAELGVYSTEEILRVARWKPDMRISQDKLDKGLERLRDWLDDNGHREARLPELNLHDRVGLEVRPEKSEIDIFLPVKVGPRVEIYFDNVCFTCAEMKWKFPELLGLKSQKRFNEWIVKDFAKRLELYFQREGYYQVAVNYEFRETTAPNGQAVKEIRLAAEKGPRIKIRSIEFKEAKSFSEKELRRLLTNTEIYVDEDFDKDLQNVINHYNSRGFLRAKIAQRLVTYDEAAHRFDIDVVVDEGPRTTLRRLTIQNASAISEANLRRAIAAMDEPLRADQAFNPFLVQPTKTVLLSEYYKRGYGKARIRSTLEISEDEHFADLTLVITEGGQYRFGNVYLRGNKLTHRNVIERELVIREGDPYNFEKIFRSEQALTQLGFFTSVDIRPVSQDLDSPEVDMMVIVQERKSGYITADLGYNTFNGYNTAFEIGHRNLAGYGRALSFRFEGAVNDPTFILDKYGATLAFTWPWIARVPIDGTLTVSGIEQAEIAYDHRAMTVTIGTSLAWRRMLNFVEATNRKESLREAAANSHRSLDPITLRLDYELSKDFIFNVSEAATDQEQGEVLLSTISPIVLIEIRDNVFNPTRWMTGSLRFDYGAPWLQSQIDYLKVTGHVACYLPLFKALKFLPGWVFAQNVTVGHLQALRETDTVPISRRFFLGGSTTLRGFGQNEISPFGGDGRTPVGGYFMGYQNTELRIPLGVYNLGLLAFFDAGNVTDSTADFVFEDIRATAGTGLRYITPVGPISADIGFKLNREPDESLYEFYITIGNAF